MFVDRWLIAKRRKETIQSKTFERNHRKVNDKSSKIRYSPTQKVPD